MEKIDQKLQSKEVSQPIEVVNASDTKANQTEQMQQSEKVVE